MRLRLLHARKRDLPTQNCHSKTLGTSVYAEDINSRGLEHAEFIAVRNEGGVTVTGGQSGLVAWWVVVETRALTASGQNTSSNVLVNQQIHKVHIQIQTRVS